MKTTKISIFGTPKSFKRAKRSEMILAAIIVAIFLSQSASDLTNINTCQNLNVANEIYNLTTNVNNESTCFIRGR